MSWLFTVEQKIVKPQPETLLVSPFKEIWERDTNEGKNLALKQFAYIEFLVSVKDTNPYVGYTEDERIRRIKKDVMGDPTYEPDELVIEGLNWLTKHQYDSSPSLRYYEAALRAMEKLQDFFDSFDMNSRNEKSGVPLYKPKDITSAIIDTENSLQKLVAIKNKVHNEIFESVKVKGQKKVSVFADPKTL
jgi:hypothetical protein